MSIAIHGAGGSEVQTGTPRPADNTGRDVGQAVGIGAQVAGSVIGSILTWGAASPALVALDAASIGATVASDAAQDSSQAADQKRALQSKLDSAQKARSNSAPATSPIPSNNPSLTATSPSPNPIPQLTSGQTPLPPPQSNVQMTSDRRSKTKITSGYSASEDFLDLVRRSGTWPKDIKDPKA